MGRTIVEEPVRRAEAVCLDREPKRRAAGGIERGLLFLTGLCGLTIALGIAQLLAGWEPFPGVWDDGYMFVRYADNLRLHGMIAWNADGEPTYGLTSLAFLGVVTLARLLTPDNPVLAALLSSLACGLVWFLLLLRLPARTLAAGPLVRRAVLLVALASLVGCLSTLMLHLGSGMDTMFVLAYLTAYILLSRRLEQARAGTAILGLGIFGGLAFSVRPDLLLYTLLVPLATLLLAPTAEGRRRGGIVLLVTALAVGLQMALAALYFGSPLPLPFYAKALGLYEDFNRAKYRPVPLRQLLDYLLAYRFLAFIILADLLINRRQGLRLRSPLEIGLLAATALFVGYYLCCVLQIMHAGQRFYYPTLPALIFLAGQGCARLAGRMPLAMKDALRDAPRALATFATAALAVALLPLPLELLRDVAPKLAKRPLRPFDVTAGYRQAFQHYWFRLDAFSALPDDLVMATTEVGHPAAMNPRKTIIDLAGLNETAFARRKFSAARLLEIYRPDLIYMPHPDYRAILRDITAHPRFAQEYDWIPAKRLGTAMGVALRRDSRHYAAMRRIVQTRPAAKPSLSAEEKAQEL